MDKYYIVIEDKFDNEVHREEFDGSHRDPEEELQNFLGSDVTLEEVSFTSLSIGDYDYRVYFQEEGSTSISATGFRVSDD